MTPRNELFRRTFALIVLVVALVSVTLFHFLHQRHHTIAQREAEAHALFLASQCVKPILWNDRLLLKSLLSASIEKKVVSYAWLERQGTPLVHTFPQGVPQGLLDLHPQGRTGTGTSAQAWQDHAGRVYFDIAAPIPSPAGGTLHVGIAEMDVDAGIADMLPATLSIAAFSLVLGAALAWLIANLVTRETRAATQALADSELKYRTLADNTSDWEFWTGPDGKPIYNSPSCERVIGYTPAELAANPELFPGIIHPDDRARHTRHRHTAFQERREDELELRIQRKDGEMRWISHRCRPVFGPSGEYLGTRGSNTDITTRKQYELKVAHDAQEWTQAMDAFTDVIYLVDTQRRLLRANQTFYRLTCTGPEHAVGCAIVDLIHNPGEEELCPVCQAQKEQRDAVITVEADHPANSVKRPVEVTVKVIRDPSGEPHALLTSIHDLSNTRKIENELRRLNETLEQRVQEELVKNREKDHMMIQQSRLAAMGEMIGNIAHQWRQPINALGLVLANIKDAYEYKELDQEYLDKSVQSGQRLIQTMSATIDDFRNFFRPNKEKLKFRLCDGVTDAINLISHSFKNHDIEIQLEKRSERCEVMGYPNEFAQVVLNALSNARDAILERKRKGKVRVQIQNVGDTVAVSIRDNGGGIAGDILDKVFDPYFTTKEKGTGIGLYMSKMIMDNMGGSITLRNIEEGAEIVIALPQAGEAPP